MVKYTGLLLGPIFMMLGAASCISAQSGHSRFDFLKMIRIGRGGLVISIATVFIINLGYLGDGFALKTTDYLTRSSGLNPAFQQCAKVLAAGWPEWLPVPLPFYYVVGAIYQLMHTQGGHFTYFMGEASNGGWPNYVPLMLLFKLPIPTLSLIFLGIVLAIGRLPGGWRSLLFVVVPPTFFVFIVSHGSLQIGFRHLLPAVPFMVLLSGYVAEWATNVWRRAAIILALSVNAWGSIMIFPNYLMYFNTLAGGPDQGWRISIEGDDWGQGGAPLVRWLREHQINGLAFGSFGWSGRTLAREGIRTWPVPCADNGSLVAIHASTLLKPRNLQEYQCYAWMRMRKPEEKIGYSIFLYNAGERLSISSATAQRPAHPADLELFNQALKFQLVGQLFPAIRLYREYNEREPTYYQSHFNLGMALMQQGEYLSAIEEFNKTLQLWPGYTESFLHLAKCYRALGQEEKSLEYEMRYKKALK
jgi:hypothetical protein